MVNESPEFLMPGLLPSGSHSMFGMARVKGLIVALTGYRVHVVGAVTTGQLHLNGVLSGTFGLKRSECQARPPSNIPSNATVRR